MKTTTYEYALCNCQTPGRKSNGVISVGHHGAHMIKFNSNTVKFFNIFGISYSTLIKMLSPQYGI